MTRFTTKGWLVLPVALALRIPLALLTYAFEFIEGLFSALANRTEWLMDKMPKPEINPAWYEAQHKAALAKWSADHRNEQL